MFEFEEIYKGNLLFILCLIKEKLSFKKSQEKKSNLL